MSAANTYSSLLTYLIIIVVYGIGVMFGIQSETDHLYGSAIVGIERRWFFRGEGVISPQNGICNAQPRTTMLVGDGEVLLAILGAQRSWPIVKSCIMYYRIDFYVVFFRFFSLFSPFFPPSSL